MIKVILWDIDGTLLDFKEAERQAREAARKAARQKELESTNVTELEPVENGESTFLKLAGAAAIFLAGVGLGAFIKNN